MDKKILKIVYNLYKCPDNQNYIILSSPNSALLANLGIKTGSLIKKEKTYPLGGPVLILLFQRQVAIGKEFANSIYVSEP
ncbi:MAG: ferrous iron transport protein A, partial [Clostridiaceae bacterium]|nr:ferrous iron transport protein A [Clostridiaceae bacterium]